ncbi:hypothetical protein G7085_01605 [Tessaracoccus sp. HDW20]|uniref:hypothetical protein n=1 Tax=Tessaracoccus coleopterorum TaxID=2714950 RepID=UPI0018D35421|nr:hypothetical protein [Tessaracoccus coleopterorum]NHB83827.1 hypothetical protein [Tessaracoccus coleopterorum]
MPWSVLLAARIHKHHITRNVWTAVAITVSGVVGFTVFSSLFAKGDRLVTFTPVLISFVVVCGICAILSFFANRAAPGPRPRCGRRWEPRSTASPPGS